MQQKNKPLSPILSLLNIPNIQDGFLTAPGH